MPHSTKRIFIMSFSSYAGGVERSLMDFLQFLESCGCYDIDLYLWRGPGPLFNQIPQSVHVLNQELDAAELKERDGIWAKFSYYLWHVFYRLTWKMGFRSISCKQLKCADRYDIAISYTHGGFSPYYVIDKIRADKKLLWYHHGSYEKRGRARRVDAHYYAQYDYIITVSDACRNMLGKVFPALLHKMKVISNLVDGNSILKKAAEPISNTPPPNKLILVTVARIHFKEKGQKLAIETAKLLRTRGLEFCWYFVGGGPNEQECRELIEEAGLREICFMTGSLPNPYPYMNIADLYVQPSLIEAECLTVKEALILKKPIVATDLPALKEVLLDGELGLLCQPLAEAMADGIMRHLSDNTLREHLEANRSKLGDSCARAKRDIVSLLSLA